VVGAGWPALLRGVDVVVEPEDVARVVAALDLDEALVVDPPDFPYHLPVVGGQVVPDSTLTVPWLTEVQNCRSCPGPRTTGWAVINAAPDLDFAAGFSARRRLDVARRTRASPCMG